MVDYNSTYTGPEMDDAIGKRHTHSNLSELEKYGAIEDHPTYDENLLAFKFAQNRDIGLLTLPEYTIDGASVTFTGCQAFLCECVEFVATSSGHVMEVPGFVFTPEQDAVPYFVLATRTGGVAAYNVVTDLDGLAHPNSCPVAFVIKTSDVFHIGLADKLAVGLPNRLEQILIERDGIRQMLGLGLSAANRVVTVAEGRANYGATVKDLTTIVSNVDTIRFYTWNGSTFNYSSTTLANNTQYNGSSGLVTMTNNNRYNVNWFWRGWEEQKHLYSVLSREEYNSASAAENSSIPQPPPFVAAHAVFVGGIIYRRNQEEPVGFISPTRNGAATQLSNIHNNLGGLQGGTLDEYYHLTSAQHTGLTDGNSTILHRHANATPETDGYMSAADKAIVDSAYTPSNILGTVSQSGGVPTGAIIERGSNDDGSYVKLADGTAFAQINNLGNLSVTTADGGIYRSASELIWDLPIPFSSRPQCFGSSLGSSLRWCVSLPSASAPYPVTVRMFQGTSSETATSVGCYAQGNWFEQE